MKQGSCRVTLGRGSGGHSRKFLRSGARAKQHRTRTVRSNRLCNQQLPGRRRVMNLTFPLPEVGVVSRAGEEELSTHASGKGELVLVPIKVVRTNPGALGAASTASSSSCAVAGADVLNLIWHVARITSSSTNN